MNSKKIISTLTALILSISSYGVFAEENKDIAVTYNGEALAFDVAPIIEDGRTLVPFRAIFEAMGCVVDYYQSEDGKQSVFASRTDESLILGIGENEMYFNGEQIALDVPAKIKDGRTLVPIRAISEAFSCQVEWDADTKTVSIQSPVGHFDIKPVKLEKALTADDGTVLINAVAYYPVIDNSMQIPFIDEINEEYKLYAEQFIADASQSQEEASMLLEQMGKDAFMPYEYSLTYEEAYNIYGILTITTYGYVNRNGAHPSTTIGSRTFNPGSEMELSLSDILCEEALEDSLSTYVYNLFEKELIELGEEPDDNGTYQTLTEELGDVQYYLTEKGLVLYFNQGQIAAYALGIISVEIPYEPTLFLVDMDTNKIDEYTYELEYWSHGGWEVISYSEDIISVTEENTDYPEEDILNENFPVGMKNIKVKGLKEGYAKVNLAFIDNEENITSALISTLYIDENNDITVITESDDVTLLPITDENK